MVVMLKHYQWNFTGQLIIEIHRCFKMNSPPLKSQSRMNYFQINYSHCCTMFLCLKYFLKFICILDDWLIYPFKCVFWGIKGHVAQDILVIYLRQFHLLYNYAAFKTVGHHCQSLRTKKALHTASDSTRRSRYTTRQFSTCANILLYAHRERSDLCGVIRRRFRCAWGIKFLPQRCVASREALLPNLLWNLVWPSRNANPRHTAWEADTLTYMAISHHDAFPPYHHSLMKLRIYTWLLHLDYLWRGHYFKISYKYKNQACKV